MKCPPNLRCQTKLIETLLKATIVKSLLKLRLVCFEFCDFLLKRGLVVIVASDTVIPGF